MSRHFLLSAVRTCGSENPIYECSTGAITSVACKRLGSDSERSLEGRVLEAAEQINRAGGDGYIAINLDVMYRGQGLPLAIAERDDEFKRMVGRVLDVLRRRFGAIKAVRGVLIFGHLAAWDVSASAP